MSAIMWLIDKVGIASLIFVFVLGFGTLATGEDGIFNLMNSIVNDSDVRDDFTSFSLAKVFLTPLVKVGDSTFISLEGLGLIAIVAISLLLIRGINFIFPDMGMFISLGMFLVAFLVIGTLWQGFWLDQYMVGGMNLGISQDVLLSDLFATQFLTEGLFLFAVNIIAFIYMIRIIYPVINMIF